MPRHSAGIPIVQIGPELWVLDLSCASRLGLTIWSSRADAVASVAMTFKGGSASRLVSGNTAHLPLLPEIETALFLQQIGLR